MKERGMIRGVKADYSKKFYHSVNGFIWTKGRKGFKAKLVDIVRGLK